MEFALFTQEGLMFTLRWLHFFFGVMWIGHLYYFNFTQGGFMAEADAGAKSAVTQKLLPRALWWFRWGAMWTMTTGILILGYRGHMAGMQIFATSWGVAILLGGLMGLLMWANVWFVIWPNQKIVIANAKTVAGGGAANPAAPLSAAKGLLASRTNTLFSVPMLFFMGAASHLPLNVSSEANFGLIWGVLLLIVGGIEFNALKGKLGPMTTVKGVITSGFVLTAVLYVAVELLTK